jgi:hypothetical protein
MTANAGYHAYATGDVLTAAQVQYNLQNQTVMYFATTTARDAALTGAILVEGMVSYTPATGVMYYNGTAWTAIAGAAAAGTLTGTTLASNVVSSSLTSFGTNPTLTAPLINLGYTAKTAAYTTVLGDNGYLLSMNNAATQAFSIPTNASVAYPVGAQISFVWITGAGQPTISAVTSGTTTILSTGATSTAPKLRVVNSAATAVKIATDIWLVTGDIA